MTSPRRKNTNGYRSAVRSNKEKVLQKSAEQWMGHPVCVLMKDGSYYVGEITGVEDGYVTVAGSKGVGKLSSRDAKLAQAQQAQVSGLMEMFFGRATPPPNPPNPGNVDTRFNSGYIAPAPQSKWATILPTIKIGINMLQTIMPLLSVFKI